MPKQKLKLTKTEDQEYRMGLLRLEEMGIPTESIPHASPEPARLAVEQIDHYSACIYELLSDEIAVVVPARFRFLVSGILITDPAMYIPRLDCRLELRDGTESNHSDLINGLPYNIPPTLLNDYLTSEVPPRLRQVQGVIVAGGWTSAPLELQDKTLVKVELSLRDERRNALRFDFLARVNRGLKRKYERRVQEHHERLRLIKRESGLFDGGQFGDHESVLPEEAIDLRDAGSESNRELHKSN